MGGLMYILSFSVFENEEYYKFLELVYNVCEKFYLVERKEFGLNDIGLSILEKLQPHLLEERFQNEWAMTKLGDGGKEKVRYYKVNRESINLLKSNSNSIKDWIQPNRLEDITFIKNNHYWFMSCTHENMFDLVTIDDEEIEAIKKIKGLKYRSNEIDRDSSLLVVDALNIS